MLDDEICFGGFASSKMIKVPAVGDIIGAFSSAFSGYGIYATNKRIIGTKNYKLALLRLNAVASLITSRQDESKNFEELEKSKDIEIIKGDISRIEMTASSFMKNAVLTIYNNKSEKFLSVAIANDKDYEEIKNLMKKFYPEVLQAK
jgi:hypothetical protein